MIRLESGTYPIWDDFSLELTSDLTFSSVALYYLHGANGSGKSSFIERLLIPSLRNQKDIFLLYFEQQMHFQIQAVKAYASIMPPRKEIHNEMDTVDYLLNNLLFNYSQEPRPCFIVMDESPYELKIYEFIKQYIPDYCLIYSAHSELLPATKTLEFIPVSPSFSKIYVPFN
ncbi:MAG TPA: hypothetical protein PLE41_00690 [Candidatus Syntrophosphaera thermopropionivorans]|nr:hypothetical protein [Candidatus Syntrophosphaera thermopropionivorans]HQP83636.1 hypothetical protein [Candidatus Syntrophosphaera thermopropionivorans]